MPKNTQKRLIQPEDDFEDNFEECMKFLKDNCSFTDDLCQEIIDNCRGNLDELRLKIQEMNISAPNASTPLNDKRPSPKKMRASDIDFVDLTIPTDNSVSTATTTTFTASNREVDLNNNNFVPPPPDVSPHQFEGRYISNFREYQLNKGMNKTTVENIIKDAQAIVEGLGNPIQPGARSRSGLAIGEVQSGKTTNMNAVIALALDRGYKFIIILSGRTVVLREQTQNRVGEVFMSFKEREDPSDDESDETRLDLNYLNRLKGINWLTREGEDISGKRNKRRFERMDPRLPTVAIIKKTASALKWTENVLSQESTYETKKMQQFRGWCSSYLNLPGLIIDDECDDASLNYKAPDKDPSKVYALITSIRELFSAPCNYVGYTATPQPNLLYNPDDALFPDFFWNLECKGTDYVGLEMFRNPDLEKKIIRTVPYEEYPNLDVAPSNIVKPTNEKRGVRKIQSDFIKSNRIPSVQEALIAFAMTGAIRKWRKIDSQMGSSGQSPAASPLIPGSFGKYISNLGMCEDDFFHRVQGPYHNLHQLILNHLKIRHDKLNTDIQEGVDSLIDSSQETPASLAILTSHLRDLTRYLNDMAFQNERFTANENPSTHKWCTILANACKSRIVIYSLSKNNQDYFLKKKIELGTSSSPAIEVFFDKRKKNYHFVPFTVQEAAPPSVSNRRASTEDKDKKLYHAALFHFSMYHEENIQAWKMIKKEWAEVKKQIKLCVSERPPSGPFREMFDQVWRRLERNMRGSGLPIPELRYLREYITDIADTAEIRLSINTNAKNLDLLKEFDYNNDFPENLIIVGGQILSRGITIEGLTVSFYVRASTNDSMDTSLQHCRWFGWRKGYHDLITLYLQPRQLALFKHIAKSDLELRQELKRFISQNRDPREYKIILKKYPHFQLTQPAKRKSLKYVDGNTKFIECDTPALKIDTGALNALNILHGFIASMEARQDRVKDKPNALVLLDVDIEAFLNLLYELGEHNESMEKLALRITYINNEMSDAGKNLKLNVSIVKKIRRRNTDVIPHADHPLAKRFGISNRGRNASSPHKLGTIRGRSRRSKLNWDDFLDADVADGRIAENNRDWFDYEDDEWKEPHNRVEIAPIHVIFYLVNPLYMNKDGETLEEDYRGECPLVAASACMWKTDVVPCWNGYLPSTFYPALKRTNQN